MTLLEEVKELDKVLAMDSYKEWSYARLTVGKIIKLLETEQLNKPVVVRGVVTGDKTVPRPESPLAMQNFKTTLSTTPEPLPAEGSAKSVSVGCKTYDFHGSDILRYGRCAYCGNTE